MLQILMTILRIGCYDLDDSNLYYIDPLKNILYIAERYKFFAETFFEKEMNYMHTSKTFINNVRYVLEDFISKINMALSKKRGYIHSKHYKGYKIQNYLFLMSETDKYRKKNTVLLDFDIRLLKSILKEDSMYNHKQNFTISVIYCTLKNLKEHYNGKKSQKFMEELKTSESEKYYQVFLVKMFIKFENDKKEATVNFASLRQNE